VQEAKDNYPRPKGTSMSLDNEHWRCQVPKVDPIQPSTNVPILYTAILSRTYRAFTTTFKAMEAPFFQWERVLQFPGCGRTINEPKFIPEEFVVEENVNYWKDMSANEGANADDRR
jgi:hypothetical protein